MSARRLILVALEAEDLDYRQIAERLGLKRTTAHSALTDLYRDGEVHIASYERVNGSPRPTYRIGPGVDAHRPRKLSNTAKSRRYRAKLNRPQFADKFTAALFGYRRTGPGWTRKPASSRKPK
jgi:transposase